MTIGWDGSGEFASSLASLAQDQDLVLDDGKLVDPWTDDITCQHFICAEAKTKLFGSTRETRLKKYAFDAKKRLESWGCSNIQTIIIHFPM